MCAVVQDVRGLFLKDAFLLLDEQQLIMVSRECPQTIWLERPDAAYFVHADADLVSFRRIDSEQMQCTQCVLPRLACRDDTELAATLAMRYPIQIVSTDELVH